MRELGLDVSLHRAGRVSREALDGADLVLAMTAAIKDELQRAYPALSSKVQALTEFSGLVDEFGYDIKDPFGGSLEIYRESARQIGMAVEEVARKIKESFELRGDTDEDRDRK
jgi:protein-tyrosine-phosphatase